MTDLELRLKALELACRINRHDNEKGAVKAAELFLAFLKGKKK